MCFFVNFVKFLRTPFFTEHLREAASIPFTANLIFNSLIGKLFSFSLKSSWLKRSLQLSKTASLIINTSNCIARRSKY